MIFSSQRLVSNDFPHISWNFQIPNRSEEKKCEIKKQFKKKYDPADEKRYNIFSENLFDLKMAGKPRENAGKSFSRIFPASFACFKIFLFARPKRLHFFKNMQKNILDHSEWEYVFWKKESTKR